MDRELIVAVGDLTCRYPGAPRDALVGVSLDVRSGEFHALLGPNGSGKTTLLRAALGLVRPARGRAEILGRPASVWSRRDLARVLGAVPQRPARLLPPRVPHAALLGRSPPLSRVRGVGGSAQEGRRVHPLWEQGFLTLWYHAHHAREIAARPDAGRAAEDLGTAACGSDEA